MLYIVTKSPGHLTRDGWTACICSLRDAISGELSGGFEVVFTNVGHLYRHVDGTPMPEGIDLTEATKIAVANAAGLGEPVAA